MERKPIIQPRPKMKSVVDARFLVGKLVRGGVPGKGFVRWKRDSSEGRCWTHPSWQA